MSWPPKGSFGSRTASPLRTASAPDAPGRVAQRGAPSQQGVLAAGVILLREPPEEGEMEVLIGRYEVINAFRSERHRKCVPMRFAGEYHFPGGAKRQTDLGPLQTACRELHEEYLAGHGAAPELSATLFCKVDFPLAGRTYAQYVFIADMQENAALLQLTAESINHALRRRSSPAHAK